MQLRPLAHVYCKTSHRTPFHGLKIHERRKEIMCGLIFTLWVGRHNNGSIEDGRDLVRGSAVNTRVVKLLPLKKDEDAGNSDVRESGVNATSGGNVSPK
jgi:hypothetical protein